MHVLAPKSIRTLADLEGKTVAVDLPNGGTFVTSIIVFERLGIHANFAYIEQRLAYEKLKKGEIDAMISVQGKPSKFNSGVKDENLHFVPVDYAKSLQPDFLPAQLTSEDYPNMVPKGERIDTIAVPAVLAAYNWAPNTERYRRLARFVDVFFNKIAALQQPPFHPKWKEVALNAPRRRAPQVRSIPGRQPGARVCSGETRGSRGAVPAVPGVAEESARRALSNAVADPGRGRKPAPQPFRGCGGDARFAGDARIRGPFIS